MAHVAEALLRIKAELKDIDPDDLSRAEKNILRILKECGV